MLKNIQQFINLTNVNWNYTNRIMKKATSKIEIRCVLEKPHYTEAKINYGWRN